MAFPPVIHDVVESVRFGRALFAEIAPPPAEGRCRYCRGLLPEGAPVPSRAHFSDPSAAVRSILAPLDRGASVEAIVLGGAGEPLRHRGLGAILRRIRAQVHLGAVVLTNGVLLRDRDVRREAAEAGLLVVWLPALQDRSEPGDGYARQQAWERHVETIASLKRESSVAVALELPVRPGLNDSAASRTAWKQAVARIRPERVFVIGAPGADEPEMPSALEDMRRTLGRRAGAFLDDGTVVDRRCFCGIVDTRRSGADAASESAE